MEFGFQKILICRLYYNSRYSRKIRNKVNPLNLHEIMTHKNQSFNIHEIITEKNNKKKIVLFNLLKILLELKLMWFIKIFVK